MKITTFLVVRCPVEFARSHLYDQNVQKTWNPEVKEVRQIKGTTNEVGSMVVARESQPDYHPVQQTTLESNSELLKFESRSKGFRSVVQMQFERLDKDLCKIRIETVIEFTDWKKIPVAIIQKFSSKEPTTV